MFEAHSGSEVAYSAQCLELPGCISGGETREEALANIREAIEGYSEAFPEELDRLKRKTELAKITVCLRSNMDFPAIRSEEVMEYRREMSDIMTAFESDVESLKVKEGISEEPRCAIDSLGGKICMETEDGRCVWYSLARFFVRQHTPPKEIPQTP